MCIAIALTAVRLGANVANHTEVLELNKDTVNGKLVLSGAKVKDRLTGLFRSILQGSVITQIGLGGLGLLKVKDHFTGLFHSIVIKWFTV